MKLLVKNLIREPLVHFLLIGAALFLLFEWRGGPSSQPGGESVARSTTIVVTQGQIEHMAAQFARIWQRPPTEQELKGLIDDHVRDEISYREATAMGLDRDDATIRRRMRLKLETLNEDVAEAMTPTDQDLQAFLELHKDSFIEEPQAAFRQVYLNPDRRGAGIEVDARNLLARLRAMGPDVDLADLGDPLMGLTDDLSLSTASEIARIFGDKFSRTVVEIEPGQWQGPVLSGYGLHLVFVTERRPARLPELAEIRDRVEREWVFARKKDMQEAMYKKLGERYTVVIEQAAPTLTRVSAVDGTKSEQVVR